MEEKARQLGHTRSLVPGKLLLPMGIHFRTEIVNSPSLQKGIAPAADPVLTERLEFRSVVPVYGAILRNSNAFLWAA